MFLYGACIIKEHICNNITKIVVVVSKFVGKVRSKEGMKSNF